MRQDYRLFKLNRMMDLECCREVFGKRILPPYENEADRPFPIRFLVKARCKPSIKWRIVDDLARRLWRNCRTVILCLQPDTRTRKPVLLDTEPGRPD